MGSWNNRESPSLDNPHILVVNITEGYSRNSNICQLCSLIFHKMYQGRNSNNNNMFSTSTHCVANKRQSLIDKGFTKSRRQIYELIGLLYKICWIASLWYLFNSVFITNFSHTRSKASLIVRIWTSGSGYVSQKSLNSLWLVNVNVGRV